MKLVAMNVDSYAVDSTEKFDGQVSRFINRKRFKKLPSQIKELRDSLRKGDFPGTIIRTSVEPVLHDVYKLRLPIPDINAGKSNGYRLLYLVAADVGLAVFMAIYYKKELPAVSDAYIDGLVERSLGELM